MKLALFIFLLILLGAGMLLRPLAEHVGTELSTPGWFISVGLVVLTAVVLVCVGIFLARK